MEIASISLSTKNFRSTSGNQRVQNFGTKSCYDMHIITGSIAMYPTGVYGKTRALIEEEKNGTETLWSASPRGVLYGLESLRMVGVASP